MSIHTPTDAALRRLIELEDHHEDMAPQDWSNAIADARAALAIADHARNAHDDLVAALQDLLDALPTEQTVRLRSNADKARAALAKASS